MFSSLKVAKKHFACWICVAHLKLTTWPRRIVNRLCKLGISEEYPLTACHELVPVTLILYCVQCELNITGTATEIRLC